MRDSKIEWCDDTENIVEGCDEAAPECKNCYAVKVAVRFSGVDDDGKPLHYHGLAQRSAVRRLPQWTGEVRLRRDRLEAMTTRLFNTPRLRRIFWVSMGDIFHKEVPDEFLDEAMARVAVLPQHVFIAVTKRPERAADYTNQRDVEVRVHAAAARVWEALARKRVRARCSLAWPGWPLPNLHLLTSAGSQATADKFLPHLLRAKAGLLGVSCEPLIAPVRFDAWLHRLGWVIPGGESDAEDPRPCEFEWIQDVVEPAVAAGVPVLVKQVGTHLARRHGWTIEVEDEKTKEVRKVADFKGKNRLLFPPPLRVYQFPDPQPVTEIAA